MAERPAESTGPGTGVSWKPAPAHPRTTHFPMEMGRRPGIGACRETAAVWNPTLEKFEKKTDGVP